MCLYELYECAVTILEDGCPPDNRMYNCRFGEDDAPDCGLCWRLYLRYVMDGKVRDPYANARIDEDDDDHDTCFDEVITEGGLDEYEIAAWVTDRGRSGEGRRWYRGARPPQRKGRKIDAM